MLLIQFQHRIVELCVERTLAVDAQVQLANSHFVHFLAKINNRAITTQLVENSTTFKLISRTNLKALCNDHLCEPRQGLRSWLHEQY